MSELTPCSCVVTDPTRPRRSSVFGRWRRKGDGPETLVEDEWFIPYHPPTPSGITAGGVGQGTEKGRGRGHTKTQSESRSRIPFPRRPAFPRSGSDGSLSRPPPVIVIGEERDRVPSSTSVPTGLTAPKLLFSPLSREMRASLHQQQEQRGQERNRTPQAGQAGPSRLRSPRRRTVSMPRSGGNVYERHDADERRWAAPTMCDMLVFPRPHITALTITPPTSPGGGLSNTFDGLSLAEGKVDREREREEWQRYGERTRTKSFRREHPEVSATAALSRKGSLGKAPRSRAASFGEAILGGNAPSRRSSKAKGKEKEQRTDDAHQSAPPVVTSFAFASGHHHNKPKASRDGPSDGYTTEADSYRRRHQHSRSTPDLAQRPRVRLASSPQDDGVIIIGPGDQAASPVRNRTNPDFTKPLPPLPDEYRLRYNPSSPFKPFDTDTNKVGIALSPDRASTPTAQPPKTKVTQDDPFTDSQTQQRDTYPSSSSAAARAMLAKQHQRALTRRAFNSPRPRQRDSGPTSTSAASNTSSFYSQASHRTSGMSAISPLRRMTALEEAIGRSRAASMGEQASPNARPRNGSDAGPPTLGAPIVSAQQGPLHPREDALSSLAVAMSSEPSSETTPRMRRSSLDSQTSSPRNGQFDDFKGLFFRTPQETQVMRFMPASGRTMPVLSDGKPAGLGFDLEEDPRRQSASDDSTVEIATPVTMRPFKGSYLGQGAEAAVQHESYDLASPPPMPGAFMTDSTDTSPDSHQSVPRPDADSDDEFTIGHAPIHPVVKIGTPQGSDVTATKRRSIVPSVGTSPSANSIDTISNLNLNPTVHRSQSQTLDPNTYAHGGAAGSGGVQSSSPELRPSAASSGALRRDSTAVSFIDDFPSPPNFSQPSFESTAHTMPSASSKHASAFGQLVTGPPGAGKTTYCHGMHQFLTALERPVHIVNLDPAVTDPPYPCAVSITSLITLESVMDEYGLGPNGAMLYCIEYLEANFDWLVEQLDELLAGRGDGYVIFDTPGQVELWTNHDSLKNVVEKLQKLDYRLAAVHLSDAHYIADPTKFISVVLLALRAMLQLELPHVNVLSKIDLLSSYGELPFDLRYYTEVQDLSYLLDSLDRQPRMGKFKTLNKAMVELVEEYGMVGFETLAVEDRTSMMKLLRQLDKATGYIYVPNSSTSEPNVYGLFSTAQSQNQGYLGDVDDVQERWIDNKEMWDAREKEEWAKEGEMRAARRGAGGVQMGREEDEQ